MKQLILVFISTLVLLSCKTKNNEHSIELISKEHPLDSLPAGRRVVTGFDANGKSIILKNALFAPKAAYYYEPNVVKGYNAWLLKAVPTNLIDTSEPMMNGYDKLEPPTGGVIIRITTWAPGVKYPMHQTNTVDFGIVISGNLQLGLEADSTILGPGDLVVQRATPHWWAVIGDKPCTIAFILVDAKKDTLSARK